ncbi:hypothetical protein G7Z17_g7036 [Cylindrodendrum hubeiense]|uniref:Uncharacterized protein n=1 Tax=Cylindrodendrum hubeiense TaxID=595255 RepID=A0A9P5H4C3_9HYPO|nr:hypothetical protein G7Z17_g7036 [Cylindrodendrum hubeiense]
MVLKRKRSASELLSSPSSVSSFNSPPHGAAIRNPFATMDMTPIHLHSRTLKRFRNSRPTENEVHKRTLNMLYSAQHQTQLDDESLPAQEEPQQTCQPEANQQSLHRFWNISSMPASSPAPTLVEQPATGTSNCDESGPGISVGNGDEMDVDSMPCANRQGVLGWATVGVC